MNIDDIYREGRITFMGLELLVAPGSLVPRPETELLGRTAVETLQGMGVLEPRVIDMCCGAGNLACAVASKFPGARVWASDLTDACVTLARRNAEHLALGSRVSVCQGDLFAGLETQVAQGTIDAVVCNPPYISEHRLATDRAPLLVHEPREAFEAGPYGLSIHGRVIKDALAYLRLGGVLLLEFGAGQEKQVSLLLSRTKAYADIRLVHDSSGTPRVVVAVKSEPAGNVVR
jgi:release factor glutamine methyltransferase